MLCAHLEFHSLGTNAEFSYAPIQEDKKYGSDKEKEVPRYFKWVD